MNGSKQFNLVMILVALAVNVAFIGIGLTCGLFYMCAVNGIDIVGHLWLIAIPPAFSLVFNVLLIEAYIKISRR